MYKNLRKKQRGQKRKLATLCCYIDEIKPFREETDKYEHFHVPGDEFIQHPKTSSKIKREFCKKWLNATEDFIAKKPANLPFCKLVAIICVPEYWHSQIIIFYDKKYYDAFWDRNGLEQFWTQVSKSECSPIAKMNIVTSLLEIGYHEKIVDEDGTSECNLWFYGELLNHTK